MDELTREFVGETRDMLEGAGAALLAWEADLADRSRIDEVFRFVHTVKGSCGFLDLPRIAELAHTAETVLAGIRDGSREVTGETIAALIRIVDRIGARVAALETAPDDSKQGDTEQGDDAALIGALDRRASPRIEVEPVVAPLRTVRLAVPLLEAMMTQVSELVIARNELSRHARATDDDVLNRAFDRLSAVVGDLRESITQTRMQPIDRLFATLPRLVRDTAKACGKSVVLEIAGADVEIDREMVEAIRDPLIHIVRNAIDHGIEPGAVRIAAGKPATGTLRVTAVQSGNQVGIEIADDGAGIDSERLLAKAIAAEVVTREAAARMTPVEIDELIFAAGLSTAADVTNISGRGVGMDVVRANVERLGGTVTVENRPRQGVTVALRAPLTLSIVTALSVSAGGRAFAIPRGAVEEVAAIGGGKLRIEAVGGALIATLRDETMAAFDLARLFGLPEARGDHAVVMATTAGQRFALVVGAIGETEELVVRALAPQIAAAGPFAGQSLNDVGCPVLVLDPVALAARAGLVRVSRKREVSAPVDDRPALLLALTTAGRVAVPSSAVERIVAAPEEQWSKIGALAFFKFEGRHLHASGAPAPLAAILSDGDTRCVLPLDAVEDLVPMPLQLTRVDAHGVDALFDHDGATVRLLDVATLLAGARHPSQRLLDAGYGVVDELQPKLKAAA